MPGLCLLLCLVTGCASDGSEAAVSPGSVRYAMSGGTVPKPPLAAQTLFGAYLAGDFAVRHHDDANALAFYGDILRHEPGNGPVAARSLQITVDSGRFDLAVPLARALVVSDPDMPLANLVLAVAAFRKGDPKGAEACVGHLPNQGLFVLFRSLILAWSAAAENPDNPVGVDAALSPVARDPEISSLAQIHQALIDDLAGRVGAADHEYRVALANGTPPLRLAELAGNFWERTGKRADAGELYRSFAAAGATEAGMAPTLSPAPPPRLIADPRQGLAEALFDIGGLAANANFSDIALVATRLSLVLRPNFPQARFTLAETFVARGQIDEARAAYRAVPPGSSLYWSARIAEVQLLAKQHRPQDALAALRPIIAAQPDQAEPQIVAGDILRGTGDWNGAVAAYSRAIALIGPNAPAEQLWQLYFSRGAAREQGNDWSEGEADLRRALGLFRDPELLNYLGFAMVVRDEKLTEARGLIAAAVAEAPNTAAYVDSLGWADFHLHHYPRAKLELEQATQLAPADAEINDHLGDAYWRCGQKEDARLQWRRALSLAPDAKLAAAIHAKLGGTQTP